MSFKKGEVFGSDSESWNIAQFYTAYSFAFALKECDEMERIARTGFLHIGDDLNIDKEVLAKRRNDAIRNFHVLLTQIITNGYFKLKFAVDKARADVLELRLKAMKPNIWNKVMEKISENPDYSYFQINEEMMDKYLDKLHEIKGLLQVMLDRAGLIYRVDKEPDLDEIKRDIFENG